jgi:hypothetical protein
MLTAKHDAKNNTITITIPVGTPRPSSTGKMDLIATTGGFKELEGVVIDGRPVRANITLGMKR